jgi:hypothetical protein
MVLSKHNLINDIEGVKELMHEGKFTVEKEVRKPVLTIANCCFYCAYVIGTTLFGVDCTEWGRNMPNHVCCEHYKPDKKKIANQLSIYKSNPSMDLFQFVLYDLEKEVLE